MENITEKQPVVKNLKSLDLFDSVTFPLDRVWVVRQMITNICTTSDMKFKTSTNRESRIIKVTRTK
jgi:hypothetical protein